MAETVVDYFEFVNVNEQHRESEVRVPPRLCDCALQPVEKERAVGEVGQAVVEGQVVELFLGPLPLGDVTVHDDQPFGLAVRATNRAGGGLNKAPGAVFMANAILEPFTAAGVASFLGSFEHACAILRMDLIHRGSGCQFLGVIP